MIPLLLLVAALAHLTPAALSAYLGGTEAAWQYACYGVEATALWLCVAHSLRGGFRLPGAAVCAYGVFESVQRPACRLLLPMDRAPNLPDGVNLCDAAGVSMTVLSPIAIALVATVVAATNSR